MSDLDPIELEIIMNSTVVAAQSERVRGALRGVDSAAENTRRQFNAITQEQLKGRAATDDLASAFNRLTPAVAAYFSYNTAKSFVTELINVRGEFQKTEIALKTMLGSEEKANALMSEAIDLAAKTPFEMKDVSNGIKQLLAFQVPAEEVIDTLTRMGNVASGLGVPIDRLQLVFGQVRAKGKLMGDDLRQFTEAGVPMVAELAKKFEVTESAIYSMVSAGKIGFNDVKDVLWQMTNEGGMFFNLMEEQSKSVAGQVSNLEDAITQMFNEMGKSSQNAISTGIGGVAFLVENYSTVLDVLGGIITMYGSYKAAIMLVAAVEAARNRVITQEIALMSFSEKMKIGRLLVTERQAAATLLATQAELAGIQAKHAAAAAEGTVAGRTQASILAKQVKVATLKVEQAQEALGIATKNASAAAEVRMTAVQQLRTVVTQMATRAQALLNATMLTNPIVATIAAVGGLIYAYLKLRDNTTALDKAEKELQQTREKTKQQLDDIKSRTQELVNVTKSNTASKLEQAEAYKQLQAMYPAMLKNMDIETFKKQDAVKIQQKLNDATDRFSMKSLQSEMQKSSVAIEKLKKENDDLFKSLGRGTEGQDGAISARYERNLKLIEKEQIKLRENNNQLREKEEIQKQANMTLEQRQKYWQSEVEKIQRSIDAQKRSNAEKNTANTRLSQMNSLTGTVGAGLQALSISPLLAQLNKAQQQLGNLNKAAGGKDVPKDKAYWEAQKKKAEETIDGMAGGRNNPQAREHLQLIQEADTALKAYDYSNKETIKTENKAAAAAKKAAGERERAATQLRNKQREALKDIADAERSLEKERMSREIREIANIEDKYKKLREQAKEAKLGAAEMKRIDAMQQGETADRSYTQETAEYLKHLDEEKELFAAYEALKSKIGTEAARERYGAELKEYQNYGEKLQAEITALQSAGATQGPQLERLQELQERLAEYNRDQGKAAQDHYAQAYEAALTHEEKLAQIDRDYQAKRIELEKITDEQLRAAKLAELELQKKAAVDSANAEAFAKTEIFARLGENLIGITRRDLKLRIQALREYLQTSTGLTDEQKVKMQKELQRAENTLGATQQQTTINHLLERRKTILEAMKGYGQKSTEDAEKLKNEWIEINRLISEAGKEKLSKFAEWGRLAQETFGDIAGIIGDSNEGLSDTLNVMGELAGAAAGVVEGLLSGNPVKMVGGIIKGITTIFKLNKAARESEKKAAEEMKKRQAEQLQAQLDYNATLRQRMVDETKLNDLYKSRVGNIKEEIAARSAGMQKNLKDQQNLFNKLINMTTTVGQYTEKYGGFLGIGRKTRVVDVKQTIGALLGLGNNYDPFQKLADHPFFKKLLSGNSPFKSLIPADTVMITDDMFEKLEEINAMNPLTGDAKNAYEQLKKLRDEYGSFEEANRQLEIQLKNAISGTTAQSLADSIREGLKSGKKSFADFANDIEGFLRDAILAGISAKMIEPKIQELQDALADMMGDGILSAEERAQFQEMYMAIVNQSQEYMDIVNQAGVNLTTGSSSVNSLQGAIKGASQESIDLLAGHTAAMKLTQFETNTILKAGFAAQLEDSSKMVAVQIEIERNTRRTADNTERLHDVNDNVIKVVDGQTKHYKSLQAAGIIK